MQYGAVGQKWIERRLKELGKTKRSLAHFLGVQEPTISQVLEGSRQVKVAEVPKLAKFLNLATHDVIQALVDSANDIQAPQLGVSVRGAVQAGVWADAYEWEEDDRYIVPAPRTSPFPGVELFGLEVKGDSMDLEYPEGSVVVCAPLVQTEHEPVNGAHVVVERWNAQGEVEATVKELAVDPDGNKWLTARSSNPAFSGPIQLNGADTDTVKITAVVVGGYTPREKV